MEKTDSLIFADPEEAEHLLHDLEVALEIRFVQSEVDKLHTVGDLYDLLQLKMGTTPQPRQRCLSAVSFYRLRKAVADATGLSVTPRTAIADVFPAKTLQPQITALGERTGLRLPPVSLAPEQCILFLFGAASCAAALYFGPTTRAGIMSLLIALGFFCVLRLAKFPQSMSQHSFGDLAREMAFLNHGRLSRETGSRSSVDLWEVLDLMIRRSASYEGTIQRETRLI